MKFVDPKFYEGYMAWTKESFAVLMTTITQWWAPTVVRVSGDESMKGQMFQMEDGSLKCNFPHRLILMGNHQLYTDWLYLWWIAYTNKMHGRIYIIVKESLKNVPVIGWSMQFYNFIFLSRKWENDKTRFKQALNTLKNPDDPMWLLLFPEGTNLSAETRTKSAAWSQKTGIPDMKNQLLPRSTGLRFCLQELRSSTNWLYDATIAYEGVPKGAYGQDIFTLKSSFFEGRPPKSVNIFWRRYLISEIPYQNEEAFSRWLLNRWREKDYMLEYYFKFGNFPAEDAIKAMAAVEGKRQPRHAKAIATSVQAGGWDEFLSIFGPVTSAAGALSAVDMTEPLSFDEIMKKLGGLERPDLLKLDQAPKGIVKQETMKKALLTANAHKPLPPAVVNHLIQENPQTQAQMKKALQNSPDPQIAKRAAKAPGAMTAVPDETRRNVQRSIRETNAMISGIQTPQSRPIASPASSVRKELPLANMESMITRPLTTMAIQKAGTSIKNLAANRSQTKGTALPGQALNAPSKAKSATGNAARMTNSPNNARPLPQKAASFTTRSTKSVALSKPPPSKAASVTSDVRRPAPSVASSVAGKKKLGSVPKLNNTQRKMVGGLK